jgi:hypothetical protein
VDAFNKEMTPRGDAVTAMAKVMHSFRRDPNE